MRRVRLQRNAFVNETYCTAGSIVMLREGVAVAPFMTQLPDEPAQPAAAPFAHHDPDHTVTVHYREATGDVDIDVNGVAMHVDHAALKVDVA